MRSNLRNIQELYALHASQFTVEEDNALLQRLMQLQARVDIQLRHRTLVAQPFSSPPPGLEEDGEAELTHRWNRHRAVRVVSDTDEPSDEEQHALYEPRYMPGIQPVAGPMRRTGAGKSLPMLLLQHGTSRLLATKKEASQVLERAEKFISSIAFYPGMCMSVPGGELQFPEPKGWRDDMLFMPAMLTPVGSVLQPLALSRQSPGIFFTWKSGASSGILQGPHGPSIDHGRLKISVWDKISKLDSIGKSIRTEKVNKCGRVGASWARCYTYGLIMTNDISAKHMTCAARVRDNPQCWHEYHVMHLNNNNSHDPGNGSNFFPMFATSDKHARHDDLIKKYQEAGATVEQYRLAFQELGISEHHFERIFDQRHFNVKDN
jgi:hypothetical protein